MASGSHSYGRYSAPKNSVRSHANYLYLCV
nr:MAG TPA: hypothetical protein [Caudoviricetes sp.]